MQYGGLARVVVLYDRSWRCFGFPWPRCIVIATCFTVVPRQLFPDVTAGAAPPPPPQPLPPGTPPAPFPADANSPGFSPGLLDLRPPSGLSAKHWFLWKKSSTSVFFPFFSSLAKRAVGTMDRSVFLLLFFVDFFLSLLSRCRCCSPAKRSYIIGRSSQAQTIFLKHLRFVAG